jgi:hypothetical protein
VIHPCYATPCEGVGLDPNATANGFSGDRKGVSNEAIKRLKSVLTVVGGRIVYSDLHSQAPAPFGRAPSGP